MILPDGRVLVHNLTAMVAEALVELNPADESIQRRVLANASGHSAAGTRPHARTRRRRLLT